MVDEEQVLWRVIHLCGIQAVSNSLLAMVLRKNISTHASSNHNEAVDDK